MSNNGEMPIVSIYIVNYKYEKYLEEAIVSCLNQTFNSFEILIIDNYPTDESIKIIKKYSSDSRIRVLDREGSSLISAANLALREAVGKYIIRLDADDYFHEDALLVLANEANKDHNVKILFPDYYVVDASGSILSVVQRIDFNRKRILKDLHAHGACTLVDRAELIKVGGYDPDITCQDGYDLWVKIALENAVKNINLPLFYYRQHGASLSHDSDRLLETRTEILSKRHEKKNKSLLPKAIGIVPALGKFDKTSLINEKLLGKRIVDHSIEELLSSSQIGKVIFTTPDDELAHYISNTYLDDVIVHPRLTSENLINDHSLHDALKECLLENTSYISDEIFVANPNSPLIRSRHIDAAILVYREFDVDYLIAVSQSNLNHYIHRGEGMESIGNNSYISILDKEHERIYRQVPGVFVLSKKQIIESSNILEGVAGHIMIDERYGLSIRDKKDMLIAEVVLSESECW